MKNYNSILRTFFVSFCFVTSLSGYSQEFTMGAEFRPRAEARSGYSQPLYKESSAELLFLQRTRLSGMFESKWVNTGLTIQDSRVFGQANNRAESVSKAAAPSTFIYEAWAELILPKNFYIKVGRQPLCYDDERLFSVANWSNTGSSFDLALLSYRTSDFTGNLGYAFNNSQANPLTDDYTYGPTTYYKSMAHIWLSKRFNDSGFTVTALGVCENFQHTTTTNDPTPIERHHYSYRFTYGGNIEFKKKDFPLSLYGTIYGQAGRNQTETKIKTYLLALKASYKINKPFSINTGVDVYSGTSKDTPAGESNTFNGLYGTNHKFNGFMDYWTVSKLPVGGLINTFIDLQFQINPKLRLNAIVHSFLLQKSMVGNSKNLGEELDLDLNYKICSFASLRAGWSTYFASDITNQVAGVTGVSKNKVTADTPTRFKQWAFVSLSITPELFSTRKKH